MREYQNIFTQLQVRSAPDVGIPIRTGAWSRGDKISFSYWAGRPIGKHFLRRWLRDRL